MCSCTFCSICFVFGSCEQSCLHTLPNTTDKSQVPEKILFKSYKLFNLLEV